MLVFVDTTNGSTLSIELNSWDRVLDIKKKIEKSQGIAVSSQELYYKGQALVIDDLDLKVCNIVNYSRLLLVLPDEDYYQVLLQTEQSLPPSNYITNIEDSLGKNQAWPMMATSNNSQMLHQTEDSQVPPSRILEHFFDKDRPEMVRSYDDQILHQPEKSLLSSCSVDELLHLVPETHWTDQGMRKMQGDWPESATEGNVNIQESPGRNDNNQDLLQKSSNSFDEDFSFIEFPLSAERFSDISYFPEIITGAIINENQVLQTGQTPVPSNSTEERINTDQDLPVRVESNDQVVQSEKYPPIREVINIPDSPVKVRILKNPPQKLRVMVLPYSRENKPVSKFPVNVDASDKVGELRKELEKIQHRSPLDLPQKGYFFIHKQRMLDDAQPFSWNGVADGDTIEIISGHVTN